METYQIALTAIGAVSAVLIGIVGLFNRSQFYKLAFELKDARKDFTTAQSFTDKRVIRVDEKVDTLQGQIQEISNRDDFKDRINNMVLDAQGMVKSHDRSVLKFCLACGEISLDFYDMLSAKPFSHITMDDIVKCSETAIGRASSAVIGLEEDYQEMFWMQFKDNAESVRQIFYDIFHGALNDRKQGFEDAIANYLRKQLNLVIKKRIEFLTKN